MNMTGREIEELRLARGILESPGLAARISDALGTPLEKSMQLLPDRWKSAVTDITRRSIESALEVALWSLERDRVRTPANQWHRLAVGATGAAGGAFGLAALAIELPVSTTIMLRSIAAIGRDQGEDLGSPESRLQCIQVLALGGSSQKDDAAETGYFAARAAMARAVSEAARHVAEKGISQTGSPAIVRLISAVASRFSINVTEKAAAQAVPIVGAVGGAVINTLFMDHFQEMARGHFVVRRLERIHGKEEVRRAYENL